MGLGKNKVKRVSESILERAVDAVLVMLYFNLEIAPLVRNKRYLIEGKVEEDLGKFNYQKLKRAFLYLKQKGLIQSVKEKEVLPKITETGQKKLKNLLPSYDDKRYWDGRIYLVTYDIPEKLRSKRNYLRNYLRKIGCGMFQQSIWLTPYNPINLVNKFVNDQQLSEGLVLVSSIGKNGTIGQFLLSDLMEKVYQLKAINLRYSEFILMFKEKKETKAQLVFRFLSILQDDPQLPFSLLPDGWVGDEAYGLFKEITLHNPDAAAL